VISRFVNRQEVFDLKWIYGPFKTLYTVNPTTNPSLSLCCIIFELALAAPSLASSTTCPHNQSRDPRYRCIPHHPQAQEQQQAAQGGRGEVLAARDSGGNDELIGSKVASALRARRSISISISMRLTAVGTRCAGGSRRRGPAVPHRDVACEPEPVDLSFLNSRFLC
jgi:hypothetical protein